MDIMRCPFCSAYLDSQTLEYLENQSRGWHSGSKEALTEVGFSKAAIDVAQRTGIVAGWTFHPMFPHSSSLDAERYSIQCLAHNIGQEFTTTSQELASAKSTPDLRHNIEERTQFEFRLLAADAGCQHWAAYKKLTEKVTT